MAVLFMCSEAGKGRVVKWYTENIDFNKNIKKSGFLTIGDKGLVSSFCCSLIVLLVIRDPHLLSKDELVQNLAKTFLSDRNLTFWDSLYKDITEIKGLISFCIHKKAAEYEKDQS